MTPPCPVLAWVQAGGAWALRMHMSEICLLFMHLPWTGDFACLPSVSGLVSCYFRLSAPLESGLCPDLGSMFLTTQFLIAFASCGVTLAFLSCFFPVWPFIRPVVSSFPQWLSVAVGVLAYGLQCPFLFPWASPAHFFGRHWSAY